MEFQLCFSPCTPQLRGEFFRSEFLACRNVCTSTHVFLGFLPYLHTGKIFFSHDARAIIGKAREIPLFLKQTFKPRVYIVCKNGGQSLIGTAKKPTANK
jgi:hypothetical protein